MHPIKRRHACNVTVQDCVLRLASHGICRVARVVVYAVLGRDQVTLGRAAIRRVVDHKVSSPWAAQGRLVYILPKKSGVLL